MNEIHLGALIGALVLLIAFSAFFSGSETALMALNRYRLKHLVDQGHRAAGLTHKLLKRTDRLIGLILLGNNAVNIFASSLATVIAIRVWGDTAITWAWIPLTLIVLIFAEVTPKTLAAMHPERVAFPSAWVYTPLLKVTYPVVWAVNALANNILKLFGVFPEDEESATHALSKEELRTVLHEAGAMIPKRHKRMLLGILDLERMKVEDIMVPRNEIVGINLEDSMDDIVRQFQDSFYTRLPVFDGSIDKVVGIMHGRRAMQTLMAGTLTKEVIRSICRPPYFIPEGTPLNVQLLNFQRERRQIGLVVDEYGDIQGLVTLPDLLEEIVGEFTTDPGEASPDVTPQGDGSYLVDGGTLVRELVRGMHWHLPTDGPKTLNGLIIEYLETIPEPGTSLRLHGYPMEILQIKGNAVKTVRIHANLYRPPSDDGED
ncbi:MAG: HlyC/CorC family transporter [Chromatiales bacterium]